MHASEQLDARPDEHILGDEGLSSLRVTPDEDRGDILREEDFDELPVQEHPAPVGDDEVINGWTFESGEGTSSLEHVGERLSSLAARDQGAVKHEKLHVAPMALGEREPVSSGQVINQRRTSA